MKATHFSQGIWKVISLLFLLSISSGSKAQEINLNTYYRIVAGHNGKVLQVEHDGIENQTNVVVGMWEGKNSQQWRLEGLGDGTYKILAKQSGKVLDAKMESDHQVCVVQHEWNGSESQRWKIESVGDGYYRIEAKQSRRILDVNFADHQDHAVLHEWYGGSNQRWRIEPIADYDLTGYWEDPNGGKYFIRQLGNQLWWYAENLPEETNVFKGSIYSDIIIGEWIDLPKGRSLGAGTLELRIVNNDRLEKTYSSVPYVGSVWVRGFYYTE